jgi:uncharacterized protein
MKCPADDAELRMTERQGIEIDYCPRCRGVWLDRGELDRLIDRAALSSSARGEREGYDDDDERDRARAYAGERREQRGDVRYREDDGISGRYYERKKGKRKSFLGELFDFD